jgi:hypothetical protein
VVGFASVSPVVAVVVASLVPDDGVTVPASSLPPTPPHAASHENPRAAHVLRPVPIAMARR